MLKCSQLAWLAVLSAVCGTLMPGWLYAQTESSSADQLRFSDVAAGRARVVDLAWPLNEQANYWPGEKYAPFQLETIATLSRDGVLSKRMTLPEHIGTHLDAPNHFEEGQPDVAQLRPEDLFSEGVLIDVSLQVEVDPDYALSVEDIAEFERTHGRIPDGAIVLLKTGWGRFWSEPARYLGRDIRGGLHFPSYSEEAADFLVSDRAVKGIGVDTLSIDRGLSRTFEVHHIVNRSGRYGLENVAALDQLPARGFYLVVAPMKIEQGTGGPTRIFAILPAK